MMATTIDEKKESIVTVEFYSSEAVCKYAQNNLLYPRSRVEVRKIDGELPKKLLKLGVEDSRGMALMENFTILNLKHLRKFIFDLKEIEIQTIFGPIKRQAYILSNVGEINNIEIE